LTVQAILIVLLSGILHAAWNLAGKHYRPSLSFFLVAEGSMAVLLLPLFWVYREALASVPTHFWILLPASCACQVVYYVGLAGAYRRGALSVMYPLSRALPVLLVALFALAVGRPVGAWAFIGMLMVTVGCLVLPLHTFSGWSISSYLSPATLLAGLAALGTTAYTLLDDALLRILREQIPNPLSALSAAIAYAPALSLMNTVGLGLAVACSRNERDPWREVTRLYLGPAVFSGVGIWASYGLLLVAMGLVRDVSYVASFRQVSIPLGVMLGIVLLREPRYPPKMVGCLAITAGLILLAAF
jgi:uncharacterized membrane protein